MKEKFFDIYDRNDMTLAFETILKENLYIRVSDERIKIENISVAVEEVLDELERIVN